MLAARSPSPPASPWKPLFFENDFSDYVGAVYLRPSPLLDLSYRFRLGSDDLKFRRSDLLAVGGPAFFRVNVGF